MHYFQSHGIGRYEATWWVMDPKHEEAVATKCGCRSKHVTCDLLFNLLGHAYSVDEGEFIATTREQVTALSKSVAAKMHRTLNAR